MGRRSLPRCDSDDPERIYALLLELPGNGARSAMRTRIERLEVADSWRIVSGDFTRGWATNEAIVQLLDSKRLELQLVRQPNSQRWQVVATLRVTTTASGESSNGAWHGGRRG